MHRRLWGFWIWLYLHLTRLILWTSFPIKFDWNLLIKNLNASEIISKYFLCPPATSTCIFYQDRNGSVASLWCSSDYGKLPVFCWSSSQIISQMVCKVLSAECQLACWTDGWKVWDFPRMSRVMQGGGRGRTEETLPASYFYLAAQPAWHHGSHHDKFGRKSGYLIVRQHGICIQAVSILWDDWFQFVLLPVPTLRPRISRWPECLHSTPVHPH